MELRVSLRRAFSETLRSRRVVPVALLMTCFTLVNEAANSPSTYVTLAASAPAVLIYGYLLSVSAHVAHDAADVLPPLTHIATIMRRAGSIYVLLLLPMVGLSAIAAVGSLAFVPIADAVDPPALWDGLAVAGFAFVTFAIILWMTVGDVAVSGRYVWFDQLREGLRYRDALLRFWRWRRDGFVPIALIVVTAIANLLLRWGVGSALDTRMLRGFADAVLGLVSGPSIKSAVHVAVVLGLHVANVPVQLAYAHAVGQYSRIAYGNEEATEAPPAQQAFP